MPRATHTEIVAELQAAIANREIRNIDLQRLKSDANRRYEDEREAVDGWYDADAPLEVHHCAGYVKRAVKAGNGAHPVVPVCEKWAAVWALVTEAKAYVVKGRKTRERTRQEIASDAQRRTCQICGRPIHAKRGRIAHHGYTRPVPGWQTGSCAGAMELPFEVSRDALARHLDNVAADLERTRDQLESLNSGKAPVFRTVYVRGADGKTVRYFDAVARTYKYQTAVEQAQPGDEDEPALRMKAVRAAQQKVAALTDYIQHQQERFDAWRPV